MEILDPSKHDPEEYEGKLVPFGDGEYFVGAYVAIGAEKIVHKLVNLHSRLSLHLIKVYRKVDPRQRYGATSESHAMQAQLFKIVPWELRIPGFGAFGVIAERSLSTAPLGDDPESEHLIDLADAMADANKTSDAVVAYKSILLRWPNHSHALHNLAVMQRRLGQHNDAYASALAAVKVESHYPPYWHTLFFAAAECRYLYRALAHYRALKERFEFDCHIDEQAIDLYLKGARTSEARSCLDRSYLLPDDVRARLLFAINEMTEAREHAAGLIAEEEQEAAARLKQRLPPYKLVTLQTAHDLCSEETITAINLGLALLHEGEFNSAKEILLRQLFRFSPTADRVCLVNAAYCAIELNDFQTAMGLIEWVVEDLRMASESLETDSWVDAPGKAVLVVELDGDVASIEAPGHALALVKRLVESLSDAVPPGVNWLYDGLKTMDERRRSHARSSESHQEKR